MLRDIDLKRWELMGEMDRAFEWKKWADSIPYIQWPSDWLVKAVPPFTGAIVRYRVKKKGMKDGESISVYLDCYDMLGCFGEPYWEVYMVDDDIVRCEMANIEKLIEYISRGLDQI